MLGESSVDKLKSIADTDNKEQAFLSKCENAKAEALVEKEKCRIKLRKKEQKKKHRKKFQNYLEGPSVSLTIYWACTF